ncbi:hypothetical protein ACIRP2_10725 [Streptomyces sp. NPDC101194]|uniref:SCO2400 family protein n=1 Tax=Streptomyces sp. NPDC101194 TaxID=3366127 RepID=UPI00380ECED0
MDYCSSCRRHLNGALVCPGCGAYAPDIAPDITADIAPGAVAGHAVPARATAAAYEFSPSDTWHDDGGPGDEAAASTGPVPAAPRGRAARRRERARWKKNKRRAVVATAVALVGGGLTVTAMDRQSADRAQAAGAPTVPAPDVASMGSEEEPTQQHPGASAARPPETRRSSLTPAARSSANTAPRHRSVAAPAHVTPLNARPDAPVAPRTVAASVPQPRSSVPSAVTDTAPDPTATPPQQAAAPADNTGNTGNTGSDSAAPANPPSASTSPSQLCVLVLCIG